MREIFGREQMREMSEGCGAILPTHDLSGASEKISRGASVSGEQLKHKVSYCVLTLVVLNR